MKLQIANVATGYDRNVVSTELNLYIPEGKITALVGPNGCGKSTLLKTICLIISPLKGEILLGGKNIREYSNRELAKIIGILPQNPIAPNELTVRELVRYGRAPHMAAFFASVSKEDEHIIEWALRETAMLELAARNVQELSGGQRQRAWIAMAIAQKTDILFLDEPTSFLDVSHQMEVLHIIQYLNKSYNTTIVMVIHELNEAARFADHLIAMKGGKILYEGIPKDIFTKDMLKQTFGIDSELMVDPRTGKPFCIPYSLERNRGDYE